MSRLFYYFLLSIMLTPFTVFAQADLVVRQASFEPRQIDKGDVLTVRATVANIGNVSAAANYLLVYYSQDLTIEPTEIVSRVSVRALNPGDTQEVEFFYPVSPSFAVGNYVVAMAVDPFNDVPETDDANLFCVSEGQDCSLLSITDFIAPAQRYNFPMIFVHGLNSDSDTWNQFLVTTQRELGWAYGGRFDYCLNTDNDQSTSDGNFLSFTDFDNLTLGDFYTLNFDVNAFGETFVSNDGIPFNNYDSDQSAIVKQGLAVSDAVEKVLVFTGADKVILVGHSMGGLASREYLQNPTNWQADGDHHVAKLLTIGTPHGGSNVAGAGLAILDGINEFSEAVRDLRYTSVLFSGQYLNGGVESSFSLFVNNDVNCNNQAGDLITGLNEKLSPVDVDYSCIVSNWSGLPGSDGLVDVDRADYNNYLSAPAPLLNPHADRYIVESRHDRIHTDNYPVLLQALDEPDFYELAYPLSLERLQFSHVSQQAENHLISPPNDNIDWDDFRIEVPAGGLVDVRVWNIPVHTFSVSLVDQNGTLLTEAQSLGNSQLNLSAELPAGSYFLEFGGIPTPNSWRFPFAHFVSVIPAEPVVAQFSANIVQGCAPLSVNYSSEGTGSPTSFSWTFPGGTPASSDLPNPSVTYNSAGTYMASLIVNNAITADTLTRETYVEVLTTATPAFTHDAPRSRTVSFEDETQFSGEIPSYSWDFGDGQSSTEPSPIHTYPANEIYEVTLTTNNQCGAIAIAQTINLTTVATTAPYNELVMTLSPNPAKDVFNLQVSGDFYGPMSATIINQIGQTLATRTLRKSNDTNSFTFDVNHLPPGTYHLQLTASTLSKTVSFIKR